MKNICRFFLGLEGGGPFARERIRKRSASGAIHIEEWSKPFRDFSQQASLTQAFDQVTSLVRFPTGQALAEQVEANSKGAAFANDLPAWIAECRWVACRILVEIWAPHETDGITADERLRNRTVVSVAEVVEARRVGLAPEVFVAVRRRIAAGGGVAVGLITVALLNCPGRIGQSRGAAQAVAQEVRHAVRIGAREDFVESAGEQVGAGCAAAQFLDCVAAVVEIGSVDAVDGLGDAPAERIVREAGSIAAIDGNQVVPRVPGVGMRPITGQVAVEVVA